MNRVGATIRTYPAVVSPAIAGAVPGSNTWLKAVIGTEPALQFSSIVRDANGLISTANVTWPDGTTGTWTTTAATALGITVFNVTYGSPVTKTVNATVTRDGNGAATATSLTVS